MKKILIAALSCLLLVGCSTQNDKKEEQETPTPPVYENENFIPNEFDNDYGIVEETKYSTIFDNNFDATCRIRANYGKGDTNRTDQASGFVYKHNEDDYYVVTSASRVAYKQIIKREVNFDFNGLFEFRFNDGRKYRGTYVGCYKDFDIAVFRIKTKDFLPVAILGKSDDLKIGQTVGAIGTPDVSQDLFNSYVEGVISGLNRKAKSYFQSNVISIFSAFQFDAPTNNGMQGGTVLNSKGEVVGLIANKQVDDSIYESLSFAVAIDDIQNMVDQIIKNGIFDKCLLGFTGGSINFVNQAPWEWVDKEGIFSGICVIEVNEEGKAYSAGLRNQSVIVGIKNTQGKEININSMEEFQSQLVRLSKGETITLLVRREKVGHNEEIVIIL